jgi:predicted PurR-regulated permease PerM
MSATDNLPPPAGPAKQGPTALPVLLKKLGIWVLFLALLYLARDFFFTAFMTFLFCYLSLGVVGLVMKRLSPDRERPGLRRLLTVGFFILVPLLLIGVGILVGPHLVDQGQHLAGWLSHTSPEMEVSRVLERYIGSSQFKQNYGGPDDPRYQKALAEFRTTGERHVTEYQDFPQLEAWVEGGFRRQFDEAQQGRIRLRLAREGTSSQEFVQWFLTQKVPQLQEQARQQVPEKGRPSIPVDPLVRAAASAKPEQLLEQARRDPALLSALRQEWTGDTLEQQVAAARQSPAYQEQFRMHYENERAKAPQSIPYTFEEYTTLEKVRPQGARAFGDALEKLRPTAAGDSETRLRADFEAAKKHELFQEWWATNSAAKFLRRQLEGGADGGARMDRVLTSLINVPIDLGTALLLSLFICIDFPNLKRAFPRLRDTWLRDVYDEMAPALSSLGQLIGRSMHAQGLIALCNAIVMFFALTLLGVAHAALLSGAAFVLCLVPTLGTIIAWVLIAAVALLQPGGGLALALKASAAVLIVVLLETFVFSPRILGRMMELHPVLIIAILPLAQYFFGVWGLILATPVAVYVLHVLVLRQGLPGIDAPKKPPAEGPEDRPMDSTAQQESASAEGKPTLVAPSAAK